MDPDDISKPAASADFAAFFRAEYRNIQYHVMLAGATQEEADEATEATMFELWRRWATITAPQAYAQKAAVRKYFDERTRKRRYGFYSLEPESVVEDGYVDANLTIWEDQERVRELLESLPEPQRDVVEMILEEFTSQEVAEALGTTPAAVRRRLCSARRKLKAGLQKPAGEDNVAGSQRKEAR